MDYHTLIDPRLKLFKLDIATAIFIHKCELGRDKLQNGHFRGLWYPARLANSEDSCGNELAQLLAVETTTVVQVERIEEQPDALFILGILAEEDHDNPCLVKVDVLS